MKTKLHILLMGMVMFIGMFATQAATAQNYLNLSVDQVIQGGITPPMAADLISQGYSKGYVCQDLYITGLSFKNGQGEMYYQNGWLSTGVIVFYKEYTYMGYDFLDIITETGGHQAASCSSSDKALICKFYW